MDASTSTRAVLEPIASSLGAKPSQVDAFVAHIEDEHWYRTAGDLRDALRDGDAWAALEIPGRLKLALKRALLGGMDSMDEPSGGGGSGGSGGGGG